MTLSQDNLSAPPGTKFTFLGENGYDDDVPHAIKQRLVVGQQYTLAWIDVYDSYSLMEFVEFPAKRFNSVMFECEYDEKDTYTGWLDTFNSLYDRFI